MNFEKSRGFVFFIRGIGIFIEYYKIYNTFIYIYLNVFQNNFSNYLDENDQNNLDWEIGSH